MAGRLRLALARECHRRADRVPSACAGLDGRDSGVNEAGPNREPAQSVMPQRISRGVEKKKAECCVDAENHLFGRWSAPH